MVNASEESKDIFRIWADSYTSVSKMWEDAYTNLYKPWIDNTEKLVDKAAELSKEPTPERYREFYGQWMNAYQNSFGKLYPTPKRESDKEMLEKLAASAETTSNLFKSWARTLDENAAKTKELLQGAPDPEKYREFYSTWMKTYGKLFDEMLALPTTESTRQMFESYTGVPSTYLNGFVYMSKPLRDYMNVYWPWMDSMMRLSGKMADISRGEASPEAYREFYNLWMNAYRETYRRLFNVESIRPVSKEMLDSFIKSTDVYLNMYKSWIAALEKMSEKTSEISKRTSDPEAHREFYNTWLKMNERAFDDFFRYMPMVGPMKNMMEPVKNATRMYTDMFTNMSNMWMRSTLGTTSRA